MRFKSLKLIETCLDIDLVRKCEIERIRGILSIKKDRGLTGLCRVSILRVT
jgi:hypothetical protein